MKTRFSIYKTGLKWGAVEGFGAREQLPVYSQEEAGEIRGLGWVPGTGIVRLKHISGRQMFLYLSIFRETEGFI